MWFTWQNYLLQIKYAAPVKTGSINAFLATSLTAAAKPTPDGVVFTTPESRLRRTQGHGLALAEGCSLPTPFGNIGGRSFAMNWSGECRVRDPFDGTARDAREAQNLRLGMDYFPNLPVVNRHERRLLFYGVSGVRHLICFEYRPITRKCCRKAAHIGHFREQWGGPYRSCRVADVSPEFKTRRFGTASVSVCQQGHHYEHNQRRFMGRRQPEGP